MESKLPTVPEILGAAGIKRIQNQIDLNTALNQPPRQEWLKQHPQAKNVKYIPIEIIEYLLTAIFTQWKVEVMNYGIIANSVTVHIKLHYLNPASQQWDWQDGVGACPIQTDKGASATDWTQVKSAGVQMALPAAESYAIKDAAEKLGAFFGKDINRKDVMVYGNMGDRMTSTLKKKLEQMIEFSQDENLKHSVVDQVISAEDTGNANAEFYAQMIEKMGGKV